MKLAFGIAMFCFILLGVISIIGVLWALYNKKRRKIWIISIFINVFLFIGAGIFYNHQLTPEERNDFAAQREQRRMEQAAQKITEQPFISPQPIKNTTLETRSAESILTSIASESLGKNFKEIKISTFIDDSTKKFVLVYYDGNDGWDNAMTKKAMLIQTADLFQKLFASGIAIQEVNAFIYGDMMGPNGPRKDLSMKCQLKGSTAANINWGKINKTKFDQNIDYIWMTPALREIK